MGRWIASVWLGLALACGPALAQEEDLESRIAEIERLAVTAHWGRSEAEIAQLEEQGTELSHAQRQRLEFVRLRNRAISGDQAGALEGFEALLKQDLPVKLRLRAYNTAISVAANRENWSRAFTWLSEALTYLSEVPDEAAGMLSSASYLHTLVGETDKARDLAMRSLEMVQPLNDPRALCMALSDIALAEDHAGRFAEAEAWRRRQIEACSRAGDPIFVANGKYGVGKMAARQGRHSEALDWSRQALAEFEQAGFTAGAWSARLVLAESLIALDRDLDRADAMLDGTLAYYRGQQAHLAIAETEQLRARLAERRGHLEAALAHFRAGAEATAIAERDARERRLTYLQVEFDTRLKEQQIALLEAEKELAALQVTATQRRQWLLAAGMGGLVIIAVLLGLLLRHTLRERRRYRWRSEHDSLTGLYNYQHARRLGGEAFLRARSEGRPFTAVVLDIDRFKSVNDRHGHAAGDEALRALGGWIHEEVGEAGIAGRSGGDEFMILLDADATATAELLERLRARVQPIAVFGQTVRFSISSGVCQAGDQADDLEQLIHEADQALYRAKHEGRDRVVHADGGPQSAARAPGGLVVVGSGIDFGRHISERCLSEIREADVVLCLVDPFSLGMIRDFRPDAIHLGVHYADGKDRRDTYREMDATIMDQVRTGKRVCAVFYGHPGVFADVPHAVVRKARAEGFHARMEPGISAEACLYADLGLDPGRYGVQSIEATQLMVYERVPDTAGLVLLWQVALAGDTSCTRFHAEPAGLQALVDRLQRWYPADHGVILYEAARLPIETPRIEHLCLHELPHARYEEYTTLVIPPLPQERRAVAEANDRQSPPGN
ncbi:diguanylate cyclase [Luteimonas sp. SDU101]|uniref:diguanylate cyclase n=1 Tax=Luteimonas sp. SDU101 TaxID=3422593 RepID=UPI003EBAB303